MKTDRFGSEKGQLKFQKQIDSLLIKVILKWSWYTLSRITKGNSLLEYFLCLYLLCNLCKKFRPICFMIVFLPSGFGNSLVIWILICYLPC